MSNQPPPYSEAVKPHGEPNYGAVPAGAYQPAGAAPQGYPAGAAPQGYPAGAAPQGYPQGYPAGAYQGGPGAPQQGYGPPGAPQQAYGPPGGYNYDPSKQPPAGAAPSYQQPQYTIQPQTVVMVGGCPACRVGVLEEDFTCLGVFCAIMFFPIGLLCCLAMRQRRCVSCGAVFG